MQYVLQHYVDVMERFEGSTQYARHDVASKVPCSQGLESLVPRGVKHRSSRFLPVLLHIGQSEQTSEFLGGEYCPFARGPIRAESSSAGGNGSIQNPVFDSVDRFELGALLPQGSMLNYLVGRYVCNYFPC